MKKELCLFATVAIAFLLFSASALAQNPVTNDGPYFVTYFSNNVSGAPDATVRIINDGADSLATLWANIYVFDDSQELQACGSCSITADGILAEDVKTELTNNPLTGRVPARGVIKVLTGTSGNPASVGSLETGLTGWATHIQRSSPTSGTYYGTESAMGNSTLSAGELSLLQNLCYYAGLLGSGQGLVTCTPEDHDF